MSPLEGQCLIFGKQVSRLWKASVSSLASVSPLEGQCLTLGRLISLFWKASVSFLEDQCLTLKGQCHHWKASVSSFGHFWKVSMSPLEIHHLISEGCVIFERPVCHLLKASISLRKANGSPSKGYCLIIVRPVCHVWKASVSHWGRLLSNHCKANVPPLESQCVTFGRLLSYHCTCHLWKACVSTLKGQCLSLKGHYITFGKLVSLFGRPVCHIQKASISLEGQCLTFQRLMSQFRRSVYHIWEAITTEYILLMKHTRYFLYIIKLAIVSI